MCTAGKCRWNAALSQERNDFLSRGLEQTPWGVKPGYVCDSSPLNTRCSGQLGWRIGFQLWLLWSYQSQCNLKYRVHSLRWRHNGRDGVSNHQPHDCLLNRLFRRRSKKTSKLHVTGLCVGKSPGPVNSPHKWPVTRKLSPFDDVIMEICRCHSENRSLLAWCICVSLWAFTS